MKPWVPPKHVVQNNNFTFPKDNQKEHTITRAKMKEPVDKEIKIGTDLLFVAGVGIAGLATYIWGR